MNFHKCKIIVLNSDVLHITIGHQNVIINCSPGRLKYFNLGYPIIQGPPGIIIIIKRNTNNNNNK